jgi:membrane fusion protein (multidrug efflux system)
MKSWWKWLLLVLVVAGVGLGAMRALKGRAERLQAAASTAPAAPAALELAPGDLAVVARVPLQRLVPVSGGLRAVDSALVKARVAGELRSLTVREGDPVRAGQVIGAIDTTEFELRQRQAEQTAASAQAQLDIARRALANNRALVQQGFISPTALQASEANEAAAEATWRAAVAAADLARKSRGDAALVAPITGTVSQRLAQPGERVAVDARVVEIVNLARLELEAALPADDVARLTVGDRAELEVDGVDRPVGARVARIAPTAQAGSRAVTVYLAVDATPGLRQGLFARGAIRLPAQEVLAVPASAVRTDLAVPGIVAVEQGRAVVRKVRPGVTGEGRLAPDRAPEPLVELRAGADGTAPPAPGTRVLRASVGTVRDGTPLRLPPDGAAPGSGTNPAPPASAASR